MTLPLRQALSEALERLTDRASGMLNDATADRYRVGYADGMLEAIEAVERLAALDASATTWRETVFSCPSCGDPSARTVEPELDIHAGATYQCGECGAKVIFTTQTPEQYTQAYRAAPSPAPPEGPRDVAPATCEWTEDSGGYWATTCGKLFTAGRLSESHYRFCPYCGLTLQPVVFDDAVSADGAPGVE